MSHSNAKDEFIEHVGERPVKCAAIVRGDEYSDTKTEHLLPLGYTPEQYVAFLASLDFKYYSGYGGQELFGTIWYVDGTWSDRGEYDGSEWWNYQACPEIPEHLKGK